MMLTLRSVINRKLCPVQSHRSLGLETQGYIEQAKASILESKCTIKELVHTILGTRIFDKKLHESSSVLSQNRYSSYFIPTADKVITASTAQLLFFLFEQSHSCHDTFLRLGTSDDFFAQQPLIHNVQVLNFQNFMTWLTALIKDEIDENHLCKNIEPYVNRFYYEFIITQRNIHEIINPHFFILNLIETSEMSSDIPRRIKSIQSQYALKLRLDHFEIYDRLVKEKSIENKETRVVLKSEKEGLEKLKNSFSIPWKKNR
jgi:hypothetical protein